MVKSGLVEEAQQAIKKHTKDENLINKGVFQSIGYKEFLPMFENNLLEPNFDLLEECKSNLLLHHRQYSKRQEKMIKKQILPRNLPVIEVNSEDPKCVSGIIDIWKAFVNGETEVYSKLVKNVARERSERHLQRRYNCEICEKVLLGESVIEEHLKSRKHKALVRRLREIRTDAVPT